MTFGYLGYIWAIFGCSVFALVVGGSALFLYAVGRRARRSGQEPTTTVEALPVRPARPRPDDAA
jgi:hypothetical protein